MTADIDARTWVAVIAPSATWTLGLLNNCVRNAGLIETDSRQQSGLTATDHDNVERVADIGRYFVFPRNRAAVGTIKMKIVSKHFDQREMTELTALVAAYNLVSRFLEALAIDPEPPKR